MLNPSPSEYGAADPGRNALPGVAGENMIVPTTPPKRWMPTQPMVLGLVLVVAVAALAGMRQITLKSRINFQAKQVDYDHEAAAAQAAAYQRIMGDLARADKPLSIDMAGVTRTPFRFEHELGTEPVAAGDPGAGTIPNTTDPAEAQLRASAQRQMKLTQKVGQIQVHSVMGGRRPIARLNDEVVTIGDTIEDDFTVIAIDGRSVTLKSGDWQWTVTMDDKQSDSGKKPGRK